nr:CD180 antigen isoform X1 [Misgurnus anguillicaudatus]
MYTMERHSVLLILCYATILHFFAFNEASPWTRTLCIQIVDGYDCSDMNLQLIPDEVPNSVRTLKFAFNYLPALYNFTFERLQNLHYLDLTRCSITFVYEDIFPHHVPLEVLILIGNPLVFITNRAFSGLPGLKYLSLAQSNIKSLSDIPSDDLAYLEVLDIRGSDISSLDGLSKFRWQNMRSLQLGMNSIERISAVDLETLHNLDGMNLSLNANYISYVEPGAFQSLKFGSLDLNGCLGKMNISVLLKGLEGLKTKRLSLGLYETDPKTSIPSLALQSFCNISVIELHFQLQHFPDLNNSTFHCLDGLQKLDLTRSHLNSLPSNLSGLSTLSHLVLNENSFLDICHINANSFPMLTHLSISGNIKRLNFSSRCLEGLGSLEKLDLSFSRVNPTGPCCNDQLFGLSKLKFLSLSYGSPMIWNSQPFKVTPQLEHLDYTHLVYALNDSSPFSTLQNLKTLNLSWSNTDLTNVQLFKGLKNLQHLNLKGNTIQGGVLTQPELFRQVPLLETLILSACGISAFNDNLFKELTHLKQVDFSENQLIRFSTSAFYSLKFLQLNYANNSIMLVDVKNVKDLGNASTVDLSNNPLICNCSNFEFIQWVEENAFKVRQLTETTCNGTGRRIIDVHLHCDFPVGMPVLVVIVIVLCVILFILVFIWRIRKRYTRYTRL